MSRRFMKKKASPALMLTSLLDMFTIILIFLIVSFEAEDYDFKLDSKLTLPESQARSVFKPAINMSVTPAGVVIEDKKVVDLDRGKTKEEDRLEGRIPEVVTALEAVYRARFGELGSEDDETEIVPEGEEDENEPILLVQADKDLEYETLYLVMRSARLAGFGRYRLAVMKR